MNKMNTFILALATLGITMSTQDADNTFRIAGNDLSRVIQEARVNDLTVKIAAVGKDQTVLQFCDKCIVRADMQAFN